MESSVQDNSVEEEKGQHNPNTESKGPSGGEDPEQTNAGELPAQEDEEEEEEKHHRLISNFWEDQEELTINANLHFKSRLREEMGEDYEELEERFRENLIARSIQAVKDHWEEPVETAQVRHLIMDMISEAGLELFLTNRRAEYAEETLQEERRKVSNIQREMEENKKNGKTWKTLKPSGHQNAMS